MNAVKTERECGPHTELMRAALEGNLPALELMLNGGNDPNARDKNGRTALMFAVINMHSSSTKLLIKHGADVNAVANDGSTPIMIAASSGDTESVRELLKWGASLDAQQHWTGETALTLADKKGYRDIVDLLIGAEAKK
jgi:ankyrin repeat protein